MKCKSCDSITINGVYTHESGCLDARNIVQCDWCGQDFEQERHGQRFDSECCKNAYWGNDCDCEFCEEMDAVTA